MSQATAHSVMPATEELFDFALASLRRRSRQMLRGFPGVKRWDETDDICQTVVLQLWQVFQEERPESMRHFYAFATKRIRWCLLSLARKYDGPHGLGTKHETWDESARPSFDQAVASPAAEGPVSLAEWTEFHRQADQLPGVIGEVFSMMWYLGLPATTVASTLGISEATVRRHWREARYRLAKIL